MHLSLEVGGTVGGCLQEGHDGEQDRCCEEANLPVAQMTYLATVPLLAFFSVAFTYFKYKEGACAVHRSRHLLTED
jgi:hypothetical protein